MMTEWTAEQVAADRAQWAAEARTRKLEACVAANEAAAAAGSKLPLYDKAYLDAIETEAEVVPEVGMGATYRIWTDREACTIEKVELRKGQPWRLTLREDKATLLNGFNSGAQDALKSYPGGFAHHVEGTQRYAYEPNPEGATRVVTRRVLKTGEVVWKCEGQSAKSPGGSATIGERARFYNFNF